MINLIQLIDDMTLWLPTDNVLTETQMLSLSQSVINQVGDLEENYPEILCKSLRAVAYANIARKHNEEGALKREQIGDEEYEYYRNKERTWEHYIKGLKDICPIFGYNGLSAGGSMKINPSPVEIDIPCVVDKYL